MKPKSKEMNSEKEQEKTGKRTGKKLNFKFYIPAIATIGVLAVGGVIIGVNASSSKETESTTVYKETTVGKGNITAGVTESGNTALGSENFDYDIGSVSTSSSSGSTSSNSSSSSSSGSSTGTSGSSSSGSSTVGGTTASTGGTGSTSGASSTSSTSSTSGSSSSGSSSSSVSTELVVDTMYVAESESVTQGAAIMKVTDESYQEVLKDLTEAVATAELSLKEAQINRTLTQVDSDNTYSTNKSKKTTAQETYNNTVTKLQNAVDKAKQELDDSTEQIAEYEETISTYTSYTDDELTALEEAATKAQEKVSTLQSQMEKQSSSDQASLQTQLTEAQNAYTQAQKAYTEAKSNTEKVTEAEDKLKTLKSSYDSLQLAYQESLVSQKEGLLSAKEQLDQDLVTASNADELYDISVNGIDDDVESAQDDLDNAKEVLAAFQAFVVDGVVYSNFEGMVTAVNYAAGDSISSGNTILTYANADEVTLSVSVDQEDIATVKLNDEVNIDFTAYSGIAYKGVVTEISTSTTSENSSTVSYPVTVTVSGDVSSLYSGMTGNVTFVTKEVQNVLYVSNKAIQTKDGKSYVIVKDSSGSYQKEEVTTGFSNGTDVEIKSGVQEGDTVYIESQVNAQ